MSIIATESRYKSTPIRKAAIQSNHKIEPTTVASNCGTLWVKDAWVLFKKAPWLLIGCGITGFLILAASNFLPPSSVFLTPFLVAGFVMGTAKLDRDETMAFSDLFSGFKNHAIPLLILGAIVFAATIASALVLGIGVGVAMQAMNTSSMVLLAIASALLLAGFLALMMTMLSVAHAPCLVVFQNRTPKHAFKMAIHAMIINWKPMTVYGFVLLGLYLLALIPAGLGLLILWPLTLASTYTSYKDIFESE